MTGTEGGTDVDARLLETILRTAAQAPSAHNTQPWDPRIVDGGVDLHVAHGRTLPESDPTGRDTLLALGAWTEAARVAAEAEGRTLDVTLLPGLDDPAVTVRGSAATPVARLTLGVPAAAGATVEADAERRALGDRLTYRGRTHAVPGFLAEASGVVPKWIRLVPVASGDLQHFASLGTADAFTRPGVAEELASWLRLSPAHPKYEVDGLSDLTLLLPAPVARLGAAVTRRRRLRDTAARSARRGGDLLRRLLLELHLDAPGAAADAEHFVLVVEAKELDLGRGIELTRVLNHPLGVPASVVFEAGRVLMRVWLLAARRGASFSPHSQVLDSSLAAGELQFRLGLARRDLPLFVASVGRPDASWVPRAAKRAEWG